MGTLNPTEVRTSDLRGHWVYKGEDGVGSALILRLRQNRPPPTAGAVHSTPGSGRGRLVLALGAGWPRCGAGNPCPGHGWWRRAAGGRRPGQVTNQAAEAVTICRGQAVVRPQCRQAGAGSAVRETGV